MTQAITGRDPATTGERAAHAKRPGALHMIGNSHIDPVWLWQWQEGFQEIKATFRSALDRMEEHPDFRFTASSGSFYEWIEHNEPEMFSEIQRRVAEGRWSIVGWWVEPDCNIPGGESFVRHGLYTQRYYREKFGRTASVGYNPDSFGHSAGLPQILRKSGYHYYTFMRPQTHERDLPRIFWWEAPDGTRVLAFRIMHEYTTGPRDLEKRIRQCAEEIGQVSDELMVFYGVGNHGGGPTLANLRRIGELEEDPDLPHLEMSTPDIYFPRIEREDGRYPLVRDEFQNHARGCYAAHSGIKRWNRKAENLLVVAEKFSSIAERTTGLAYPSVYTDAWKDVLFNQFHDILAGTSIEPAYDDARDLYGEAMAIAARGLNHATQSIARRIGIEQEEGMKPIVVFNPHSWAAKVDVELEYGGLEEGDRLVDEQDRPVASQTVRSRATVAKGRNRLSFLADLPPLGYRVYRMVRRAGASTFPVIEATDHVLENDRFRLEVDPERGVIGRLFDKRPGVDVFSGDGARPVVIEDGSDTWGHTLVRLDAVVGEFEPRRVRLVEHGPVKSVIRIESEYGASRLIQDVALYREMERIDVNVTVTWDERWKALKLRFPVAVEEAVATYEVPYAWIQRPAEGVEVPGQSWVDVSGRSPSSGARYGVSILNDGKYSFDTTGSEIGLTVLRSPVYAHHDPYLPQPEGHYIFQDQGTQQFGYTILPHEGDWRAAGTPRRAAELNQRPIALVETYHEGPLPQLDSYLSVDSDHVVVTALKDGEDGPDLIVRAFETDGVATRARIDLPRWGRSISAEFGPTELKTFRVPRDASAPVAETDLLEW